MKSYFCITIETPGEYIYQSQQSPDVRHNTSFSSFEALNNTNVSIRNIGYNYLLLNLDMNPF